MHDIYDLEAEKCVLSIMITDQTKREFVFEKLKRKDFYLGWHKDIFSAILELSRENNSVDPLTVVNKMEQMGFDTESNNGIGGVVEIVNIIVISVTKKFIIKIKKMLLNKYWCLFFFFENNVLISAITINITMYTII